MGQKKKHPTRAVVSERDSTVPPRTRAGAAAARQAVVTRQPATRPPATAPSSDHTAAIAAAPTAMPSSRRTRSKSAPTPTPSTRTTPSQPPSVSSQYDSPLPPFRPDEEVRKCSRLNRECTLLGPRLFDWSNIEVLGVNEAIHDYFRHIGWDLLLENDCPVFNMLSFEFLSIFAFDSTRGLSDSHAIVFCLKGQNFNLSVNVLNLLLGVESDESSLDEWVIHIPVSYFTLPDLRAMHLLFVNAEGNYQLSRPGVSSPSHSSSADTSSSADPSLVEI
ncbi:hypothetical protein C2S52_001351 [Perilla frutescens var. hirtella]|nr:hypothetical protein C2S52_001351 [Perilla frutescens var. hirtella]